MGKKSSVNVGNGVRSQSLKTIVILFHNCF